MSVLKTCTLIRGLTKHSVVEVVDEDTTRAAMVEVIRLAPSKVNRIRMTPTHHLLYEEEGHLPKTIKAIASASPENPLMPSKDLVSHGVEQQLVQMAAMPYEAQDNLNNLECSQEMEERSSLSLQLQEFFKGPKAACIHGFRYNIVKSP
jgi:hypothetical protein